MEINNKQLQNLISAESDDLITLYLSTHKYGKEVNEGIDVLQLKNTIKELEQKLLSQGKSRDRTEKLTSPLKNMIDDTAFWHNQPDGLVIFLSEGSMEKFPLPMSVNPFIYIGRYYYVKPLISVFGKDGQFYMLKITKSGIKFYNCSRHSIQEVKLEENFPDTMEKALAQYEPEMSSRIRSGHAGAAPVFQGQGLVKEDEHIRIRKFYEKFDAQLLKFLDSRQIPMVLAGLDHLTSIYKEISAYPGIIGKTISIDPNAVEKKSLHESAYKLACETLCANQRRAFERYQKLAGTEKTSSNITEIIPAGLYKNIDALFVEENVDLWGRIENDGTTVEVHKEYRQGDEELLNMTAIHTIRNGGGVYVVRKEEMPLKGTGWAALLRAAVVISNQ